MRVLLVSTYELGHQPLHVASPAAALERAGHRVSALDLSVEQWDPQLIDDADAVAVSVPMHTAMRLALQAAGLVREQRPGLPVCLYGLYAGTSHDTVVGTLADRVISGEYEPALLEWVGSLDGHGSTDGADAADGRNSSEQIVHLGRGRFDVPARHLLPPLERYARLSDGDEERLVQVFINLLENAVKYTPDHGRISMTIRRAQGRSSPSRAMIEVVVADSGIGIPEADRPRVFERFYRVDKARSRELGGTGLGLAIVKHIVEAHSGLVWVEGNLPRGSRFVVHLPVAEELPMPASTGADNK